MGASVIALAAHRAERRIVEQLRSAGATSPERAMPLDEAPFIQARRLERLLNAQVVHRAPRGYWLDEAMYDSYRVDRRSLALVILAIVSTIAIAMLFAQRLLPR